MAISHSAEPLRQRETSARSAGRQQQAFRKELPRQPPIARAQRAADRDLPLPGRRARQQQTGKIRAR